VKVQSCADNVIRRPRGLSESAAPEDKRHRQVGMTSRMLQIQVFEFRAHLVESEPFDTGTNCPAKTGVRKLCDGGGGKDVVWFALNEDRPLFAFGGVGPNLGVTGAPSLSRSSALIWSMAS
jgi:hypothetical protein